MVFRIEISTLFKWKQTPTEPSVSNQTKQTKITSDEIKSNEPDGTGRVNSRLMVVRSKHKITMIWLGVLLVDQTKRFSLCEIECPMIHWNYKRKMKNKSLQIEQVWTIFRNWSKSFTCSFTKFTVKWDEKPIFGTNNSQIWMEKIEKKRKKYSAKYV